MALTPTQNCSAIVSIAAYAQAGAPLLSGMRYTLASINTRDSGLSQRAQPQSRFRVTGG